MTYIESAIQHLEDEGLLTDEIREALKNFAVDYNKKTREKVFVNPEKVSFGKYKDRLWADIAKFDRKYVDWCMKQSWMRPEVKHHIENL